MKEIKKENMPEKPDMAPEVKPKEVTDPVLPIQKPTRQIPDEHPIVIGDPTNPIVQPILKNPITKPFNIPIIAGNTMQSL